MNKLIDEVKSHMKEPRPADLESSLTIMCDYAKKLIDRLEAAEEVINEAAEHVGYGMVVSAGEVIEKYKRINDE